MCGLYVKTNVIINIRNINYFLMRLLLNVAPYISHLSFVSLIISAVCFTFYNSQVFESFWEKTVFIICNITSLLFYSQFFIWYFVYTFFCFVCKTN